MQDSSAQNNDTETLSSKMPSHEIINAQSVDSHSRKSKLVYISLLIIIVDAKSKST